MYPEGHFNEVKTQEKLLETLALFGIKDVQKCAKTGLVANIHGTGKAKKGGINCVAIRADIDGQSTELQSSIPIYLLEVSFTNRVLAKVLVH